jgi:hypothetical protein
MIASAMAVYGQVGDAQAKTMAARQLEASRRHDSKEEHSELGRESPNEEMKRSMLASFENSTHKK